MDRRSLGAPLRAALPGLLIGFFLLPGLLPSTASAQWTQWGGPHQDFKVDVEGLIDKFPEDGPTKLWSRELSDGYSAILVDEGTLYTMYRKDGKEFLITMDAKTGETGWEVGYDQKPTEGHMSRFGEGPRGTPLIVGDRIFSIGMAGQLYCRDKRGGKELWKKDLWGDLKGSFLNHGYSSSPFAYKDNLIVLNGGEEASVLSLSQKDGSVQWKSGKFKNSYSTPRLIKVGDQEQLLCYMGKELVAMNPSDGEVYWTYSIGNQWDQNICQPIFGSGDVLFVSSVTAGSFGLQLKRDGDKCSVEEKWSTRKVQFYHNTAVGLDGFVFGSSGAGFGGQATMFSCIDRRTGEIMWRQRGLGKATTIYADGKFIVLDENGKLALIKANEEEFEILDKATILDNPAWTVPTLAGTTLYIRDLKTIMALDLG